MPKLFIRTLNNALIREIDLDDNGHAQVPINETDDEFILEIKDAAYNSQYTDNKYHYLIQTPSSMLDRQLIINRQDYSDPTNIPISWTKYFNKNYSGIFKKQLELEALYNGRIINFNKITPLNISNMSTYGFISIYHKSSNRLICFDQGYNGQSGYLDLNDLTWHYVSLTNNQFNTGHTAYCGAIKLPNGKIFLGANSNAYHVIFDPDLLTYDYVGPSDTQALKYNSMLQLYNGNIILTPSTKSNLMLYDWKLNTISQYNLIGFNESFQYYGGFGMLGDGRYITNISRNNKIYIIDFNNNNNNNNTELIYDGADDTIDNAYNGYLIKKTNNNKIILAPYNGPSYKEFDIKTKSMINFGPNTENRHTWPHVRVSEDEFLGLTINGDSIAKVINYEENTVTNIGTPIGGFSEDPGYYTRQRDGQLYFYPVGSYNARRIDPKTKVETILPNTTVSQITTTPGGLLDGRKIFIPTFTFNKKSTIYIWESTDGWYGDPDVLEQFFEFEENPEAVV